MDAKTRQEKLNELINTASPYATKRLVYKGVSDVFEVWDIPVEFLAFNQYNGRIGTFVKQHEKLHGPIDASSADGEAIIMEYLWESNLSRNRETKQDLIVNNQLEFGIVTRDGVVIDGNRRCMLLKKIAKESHAGTAYFKAVILDETLDTNAKEIRKLETMYQMGVDAKVDYSPIEKYLKCKELISDGFTESEVALMMGEIIVSGNSRKPDIKQIKKYLGILGLMEDYLIEYNYEGMYRVLDEAKVEGPLTDLVGYLSSKPKEWIPEVDDYDDLKKIYFHSIRAVKGGTDDLRNIGNSKGLFQDKKLWDKRTTEFFTDVYPIIEAEKKLDEVREERPNEDITSIIAGIESDFRSKAKGKVEKFLNLVRQDLDLKSESEQPLKLLQRALNTLEQVNTEPDTFAGEDVMKTCHDIRKLAEGFMKELRKKEKEKNK